MINLVKSKYDNVEITAENIYEWFDKSVKDKVIITDEAIALIKKSIDDPSFDGFRFIDTMITYQHAITNTKTNLEDYLNAIRFCSFLEVNEGNATKAYIQTFSHREFVAR